MRKRMLSLFLALVMCMGLCTVARAGGREATLKYLDGSGNVKTVTIDLDDEQDPNAMGPDGMWRSNGLGYLFLNNFTGISVAMDGGDGLYLQGENSIQQLHLCAYSYSNITVSGSGSLEINNPDGKAALTLETVVYGVAEVPKIKFQNLKVTGVRDGKEEAVTIPEPNDEQASVTYASDGVAAAHVRIAYESSEPSQPEFTAWELADGKLTLVGNVPDYTSGKNVPWAQQKADIREVVVADGVTSIGDNAFLDCYNLKSVTFPDSLVRIGELAFSGDAIESVTFPDGLGWIEKSAFAGNKMQSVVIPGYVTMDGGAFAGCPNLKWVYIPNYYNVGPYAFMECKNLTDVYFGGSEDMKDHLLEQSGGFGLGDGSVTIHFDVTLNDLPTTPGPVDPVEPIDPDPPVNPEDPIVPVDPVDPADPVDPIVPTPPVTPVYPTYPNNPVPPSKPSKPGNEEKEPEKPVETLIQPEEPEISGQPEVPVQPERPSSPVYADVAPDVWYNEATAYVASRGLMTGTSATNFSPDEQMTRAQAWTLLARMSGAAVEGSTPWYAGAQAWAVSAGISDGTDPDGNITREQLAVMLYRQAGSPLTAADLSGFADHPDVSGWALPAIEWAVSVGLLQGDGAHLNPAAPATRAEVAALLMRFCENTGK